jgi:hypothetical protein
MKYKFINLLALVILLANCTNREERGLPGKRATSQAMDSSPVIPTLLKSDPSIECPEVREDLSTFDTQGLMVLQKYRGNTIILDPGGNSEVEIPNSERIRWDTGIVSSDGNFLAYNHFQPEQNVDELRIVDSGGNVIKNLPWQTNWSKMVNWLNNDTLAILNTDDKGEMVLLTPSEDKLEYIDLDELGLPNYSSNVLDEPWIEYSPSLERVIYSSNDASSVLYDLKGKKELVKVKWWSTESPDVAWSEDDQYVAVVGVSPQYIQFQESQEELYIFNRDGSLIYTTNLTDDFEGGFDIYKPSWSPDGMNLAFWIESETFGDPYYRLAVLDITKKKTSTYCFSSDKFTGPYRDGLNSPIWSLDSHQILAEVFHSETDNYVVLLDIVRNVAAKVIQDGTPIGWMDSD